MHYAIIGYGKMGKLYDRLIKAEFVVDLYPVVGKIFFNGLDEFLYYRPSVDLVIVSTPSRTHYPIVKNLLLNNYNVLCEKPICLFTEECKELECLASKNKLILYQSTLERFNPVIKFLKKNLDFKKVDRVISYRFGQKSINGENMDPKYDLGIHDVDLCFYLFNKKIAWKVFTGYGNKKREIKIYLKDNTVIVADLLNRTLLTTRKIFTPFLEENNPILEMIDFIKINKFKSNEKWSEEINILQFNVDNIIRLSA